VATVDLETINYAIKNIEAWDKVIDEIKNTRIIGYAEPNGKREIAKKTVLEIINKHFREVEQ
jgi:hypothetical protein